MIKRIISLSMALILMAGIMIPIAYADGTDSPQLTVVGKRIIDDDKYFEISLEVDGDYEDYSSVGVVLKYDPNIIVPTTWDEEAVPVDMSQSTDWASRRALPTLGKDTWTTHTALTYITQEDGKDVGYLYLGAEYPGILPNDSDASATPDPDATAAPTADPSATAAPTLGPDEDPYTNPVVVARFMYKDDTSQDTIVQKWTDAWDADWTQNEILTVAPDAISDASPAQFGFTIYNSDFSMKGFQFDYTDTVLETSEQAVKEDAQIVLGYGESAQAGGLTLNDIYVVLFYDWDDSLLGTFTCGVGEDSSADINEYLKTKFVHPQLQTQTATQLTSTARTDNYRGEYPHTGPNATNPTVPGGTGTFPDTIEQTDPTSGEKITVENPDAGTKYPLTNKLEYCFAGRDFNKDKDGNALPFVGGWTKVTAATMEDTWTALDNATNFKQTVDANGDEVADTDTDGNLLDADGNVIDMVSIDFANVAEDDVDNGTMMVKAVYIPGTNLNNGNNDQYVAIGPLTYGTVKTDVYSVDFEYRRLNASGYGVTRTKRLSVCMDLTQVGASSSTSMEIVLDSSEIMPVTMTPTSAVNTLGYQLKDTSTSNYIVGGEKSLLNSLSDGNVIQLQGPEGVIFRFNAEPYLEQAYQWSQGNGTVSAWAANVFTTLKLSGSTAGANVAAAKRKAMTQAITDCVAGAVADGKDYKELTWYQLQYAMLNTSDPYVSNDEAKAYCESYEKLMDKING